MISVIIIIFELLFLFLLSKQLTRSLSQFLYLLKFNQQWTMIFITILFLPGTIIHELAHWLMAKLLFVSTGKISLVPALEQASIRMGSVAIARVDRIRSMLIGVAPFIAGMIILFLTFSIILPMIHSMNYLFICLYIYLLFVITNSMFSSKKDLEGTGILVLLLILITIILYIFDKRLLYQLQTLVLLIPQGTLLLALYYLAIPLGLDICIILILRLFIRIL